MWVLRQLNTIAPFILLYQPLLEPWKADGSEKRVLEIQLTTATHSVDLLRAEIKREENELAREVSQLGELEKNAKAAKTERKRQTKNV